jgi:dihydrofolate reductase
MSICGGRVRRRGEKQLGVVRRSYFMADQGVRKVVAAYFVSLDGVAEAPDRFVTGWDEETDASGAELIATQDTVILGRRSYNEWADFWPTSDVEPFASFINTVPKYVATSTPLDRTWTNSHAIEGNLADFVRTLKTQPGADIGIHASISITQALLAAGLVDELRLVIAPTIAATGQKLLENLPPTDLRPLQATLTPAGHLLIHYEVVR